LFVVVNVFLVVLLKIKNIHMNIFLKTHIIYGYIRSLNDEEIF